MFMVCARGGPKKKPPSRGGSLESIFMQVGTKHHQSTLVNDNIEDFGAIRLAQEPWRFRKAVLKADLPMGAKIVAVAIIEFVNRKSGQCFASEKTIGESCGLTERGVRKAISQLKDAGWLRVVRRGVKRTNLIFPLLPVTGTAEHGDRHQQVIVTGTTVPPNLREEPLRDNHTNRPIEELPESHTAEILCFDGRKEEASDPTDSPIRRAINDHAAYCYISAAAVMLMGRQNSPKLPDGRFLDRVIWEAIPASTRSVMTEKARKGRLMRSEVAEAIRTVDLEHLSARL